MKLFNALREEGPGVIATMHGPMQLAVLEMAGAFDTTIGNLLWLRDLSGE